MIATREDTIQNRVIRRAIGANTRVPATHSLPPYSTERTDIHAENDDPLTNAKTKAIFVPMGAATYAPAIHSLFPNSTERTDIPAELDNLLSKILAAAREEIFEDGFVSQFSKGIQYLVEAYGDLAVQELAKQIIGGTVDAETASEALRWLGRTNHQASHQSRLWLLERSLFLPSLRIRDGAGLGLASLEDKSAIAYLKLAIQRERNESLRDDFQQVLSQLEQSE